MIPYQRSSSESEPPRSDRIYTSLARIRASHAALALGLLLAWSGPALGQHDERPALDDTPPDDHQAEAVATKDNEPTVSGEVPTREAPPDEVPADEVPADEVPADEVVVRASRIRRVPGAMHIVGPELLERYKYDDPHATLQLVPGVYVRQEDGFGLRPNIGIRGAISDRSKKVTLLEDGVLFGPAPYSAPAAYYFPLIGRMQQVRVVKGPAAIRTGPQTVGGAVELLTRDVPEPFAGALDLAGGQYGYRKLHAQAGASGGNTGFLIEGVHLGSSGFKQLPNDQDTGFIRNEWMFKGRHQLAVDGRQHFGVKLTYSDEKSNETYLGLTDADFDQNPLRRYAASQADEMRWHRTSAVLTHELAMSPNLRLTTQAYRHDLDRSWNKANHFAMAALFDVTSNPDLPRNQPFYDILTGNTDATAEGERLYVGPNQRRYVSQGIQSRFELGLDTGSVQHQVELGVRLHYDEVRRRHSEDAFYLVDGALVSANEPTLLTTLNRASTVALALHLADDLQWGSLTLTPGIRWEAMSSEATNRQLQGPERTQEGNFNMFLAGLGAHYALTPELGVLAGVHRGMSPPAPGSGDDVQPEASINYEGGLRYLSGYRHAEILGYYNDYQNLTNICTLSGGCDEATLDVQFDAGRARIYGLEAVLEDQLLFPGFRVPVQASYTLTYTEFLETFDSRDPIFGDVEVGDEMPYVPRHQARASLGIELDAAGAYVAGTYVSPMREEAGIAPLDLALSTEEQWILDAGAHYDDLVDGLQLYAQVRNVLDGQFIASRRPYGARPNPPRWVQVGARYSF